MNLGQSGLPEDTLTLSWLGIKPMTFIFGKTWFQSSSAVAQRTISDHNYIRGCVLDAYYGGVRHLRGGGGEDEGMNGSGDSLCSERARRCAS